MWALILIVQVAVSACSDNDPTPPAAQSNLVEATLIDTKTASEIQQLIQLTGRNIDPSIFKHNVRLYRVTYNTTYKGNETEASGVVALPITTETIGMLSLQHGTIVQHNEAPTMKDKDSFDMFIYSAVASSGLIAVIPDFIGFGESKEIFHPYYVEEPTATAVIDNIRAAKDVAANNDVSFNNKLFLAGYSQGGYATLATHKAIEEDGLDDISLIASFPASGAYDLKAIQEYFFTLDLYDDPYYIGYVAKAYQSYYGFANILTDFFNEPYASRIPTLIDGVNSQSQINSQLTYSIPDLVQANVISNINTDSQYDYIVDAFTENSLTDWTPTTKVYLYHGDADITVPFQNSVITYERFLANGASESVVEFITLPGATHATGVEPYMDDVIKKLQLLK